MTLRSDARAFQTTELVSIDFDVGYYLPEIYKYHYKSIWGVLEFDSIKPDRKYHGLKIPGEPNLCYMYDSEYYYPVLNTNSVYPEKNERLPGILAYLTRQDTNLTRQNTNYPKVSSAIPEYLEIMSFRDYDDYREALGFLNRGGV